MLDDISTISEVFFMGVLDQTRLESADPTEGAANDPLGLESPKPLPTLMISMLSFR